jgi:hypothetical protein
MMTKGKKYTYIRTGKAYNFQTVNMIFLKNGSDPDPRKFLTEPGSPKVTDLDPEHWF